MRILPLASESLGVRSLSVFVELEDGPSILIDGGVRLGEKRYGLGPTQIELRALARYRLLMEDCLRRADIVVVSHYHYDHYLPASVGYSGKMLYLKDPENHINRSQKTRGMMFNELQKDESEIIIADGKTFIHDDIELSFSPPVPHGEPDSPLGFVLMTGIRDERTGETLLHTSDIQGPVSAGTADRIIDCNPDVLVMDGAPTYLQEWQDSLILDKVEENLLTITGSLKGKIIMDHHNHRDIRWNTYFRKAYANGRIMNFAEYQGTQPLMLESKRREIWRSEHGKS